MYQIQLGHSELFQILLDFFCLSKYHWARFYALTKIVFSFISNISKYYILVFIFLKQICIITN